jgi:hypothetical protein
LGFSSAPQPRPDEYRNLTIELDHGSQRMQRCARDGR